jgi:cytidine deaminase
MEKILTLEYKHYDSIADMTAEDRELVMAAQMACNKAIASYSNFHVGAAARLESGRIVTGSNVESEVYPAGLCAERTLLYHHQATCPEDRIVALAIASVPSHRECYPCGQCRQVLHDVEKRQGLNFRVIMSGAGSATVVNSASDLMPFTFSL